MPLIVGLGNPGAEFYHTPHNVGFEIVDRLAANAGTGFRRSPSGDALESFRLEKTRTVILKPQSYMNRSGGPVQAALRYYRMTPEELLVICDDVNLPLGFIRFRKQGGAGGQKGLESVIRALSSDGFARLRVGVGGGHAGADVAAHVLRKFSSDDRQKVEDVIVRAVEAVDCYLIEGLEVAMNRYNSVREKKQVREAPAGESNSPAAKTEGSKRFDEDV